LLDVIMCLECGAFGFFKLIAPTLLKISDL